MRAPVESTVMSYLTRSTSPDAIEPDLAALWRDAAREGPVARAVMSNLIVYRCYSGVGADEAAVPDDITPVLEEVVARHPSRVIVLRHEPNAPADRSPFAITIGIRVFGPGSARYGIEQIAVRSACAEARLPSIVRQLVRGDVPTSVWWIDDVSQAPPIDAIIGVARQLVYDSRAWRSVARGLSTVASLIRTRAQLDLADVNWRRLRPVRQSLRHACSSADLKPLCRGPVRIVHRPGDQALAWLCAGWLASRLAWPRERVPAITEGETGEAVLTVEAGHPPDVVRAVLDSHHVTVTTAAAVPLIVPVPRESDANAIVEELRDLAPDACLRQAVEAASLFFQ
jgi:glucose-6-phosphate dehydrogenase assembly protein OpcA